jgi:hypothetical protein
MDDHHDYSIARDLRVVKRKVGGSGGIRTRISLLKRQDSSALELQTRKLRRLVGPSIPDPKAGRNRIYTTPKYGACGGIRTLTSLVKSQVCRPVTPHTHGPDDWC